MAGETSKARGVCLSIRPWSRTSHVVMWLTPDGRLATVVKGAVRPKSAFLGQYDLNYTCDLVYYTRAHCELHALRECSPTVRRDALRSSYRALALADYFRFVIGQLASVGREAAPWMELLERALDRLAAIPRPAALLGLLLTFELRVLDLAGLAPDFSGYDKTAEWSPFSIETGVFCCEGRVCRIRREVAACLNERQFDEKNYQFALDGARVIGVFYAFHLDWVSDVRRTVLGMISKTNQES